MSNSVPVPALGRYQHYKGREYTVLGTVRHSETMEVLVLYRQEYGNYDLWVRPVAMFLEQLSVKPDTLPNAQISDIDQSPPSLTPRFRFLGTATPEQTGHPES